VCLPPSASHDRTITHELAEGPCDFEYYALSRLALVYLISNGKDLPLLDVQETLEIRSTFLGTPGQSRSVWVVQQVHLVSKQRLESTSLLDLPRWLALR